MSEQNHIAAAFAHRQTVLYGLEHDVEPPHWFFVVDPLSNYRLAWDVGGALMMLWDVIMVPVGAFQLTNPLPAPQHSPDIQSSFVDSWFGSLRKHCTDRHAVQPEG